MTGVDIVHIPYKGSAPALTDVIAGNASMMFDCTQASVETTVGRWVERCGSDGLAVGVRLNPAYVIDAVNVSGVSTFQHQGVSNAGYTDRPVLFAGEVVSVLLMPVRA